MPNVLKPCMVEPCRDHLTKQIANRQPPGVGYPIAVSGTQYIHLPSAKACFNVSRRNKARFLSSFGRHLCRNENGFHNTPCAGKH